MRPPQQRIAIISPGLQKANNGNWQTAFRWSRFLRPHYAVSLASDWVPQKNSRLWPDCMIALHARRSADVIARFAATCPDAPLVLVLTGTDLYRDIHSDEKARRSLDLASHLVVLQEEGLNELQSAYRAKCRVVYQSATKLSRGEPNRRTFDIVLVGHMRTEKDPLTPMRALELLPPDSRVRLIHIGNALEDEYARAAKAFAAKAWPTVRRYVWRHGKPHAKTRQCIKNAQAMVISSIMEGGANVIIEAVTAGVPVLASRISGNIGMLGRDYAGYFATGDSKELAALFDKTSRDASFRRHLQQQCAKRARLFAPQLECREVINLVRNALQTRKPA